jgi:hypothetical protein
MPITAPKDWNPERMRQPPQEFNAAVVMNDGGGDHRRQRGHAVREPGGHATAMQRQIGLAGGTRHGAADSTSVRKVME